MGYAFFNIDLELFSGRYRGVNLLLLNQQFLDYAANKGSGGA